MTTVPRVSSTLVSSGGSLVDGGRESVAAAFFGERSEEDGATFDRASRDRAASEAAGSLAPCFATVSEPLIWAPVVRIGTTTFALRRREVETVWVELAHSSNST